MLVSPSKVYFVLLDKRNGRASAYEKVLAWSWRREYMERYTILFESTSMRKAVAVERQYNNYTPKEV